MAIQERYNAQKIMKEELRALALGTKIAVKGIEPVVKTTAYYAAQAVMPRIREIRNNIPLRKPVIEHSVFIFKGKA